MTIGHEKQMTPLNLSISSESMNGYQSSCAKFSWYNKRSDVKANKLNNEKMAKANKINNEKTRR